MKKMLIISGLLGTVSGGIYLCTSWDKAFLMCFVCMMAALVCWIEYEMDLADQDIEMQIEEWMIEQEQEREMLITKTAIRRELIKVWEDIA